MYSMSIKKKTYLVPLLGTGVCSIKHSRMWQNRLLFIVQIGHLTFKKKIHNIQVNPTCVVRE